MHLPYQIVAAYMLFWSYNIVALSVLYLQPNFHMLCMAMDPFSCIVTKVLSETTKSKKEGRDQELMQSSTTHDPGYQCESDNVTIRHHKREPRGQPIPSG